MLSRCVDEVDGVDESLLSLSRRRGPCRVCRQVYDGSRVVEVDESSLQDDGVDGPLVNGVVLLC